MAWTHVRLMPAMRLSAPCIAEWIPQEGRTPPGKKVRKVPRLLEALAAWFESLFGAHCPRAIRLRRTQAVSLSESCPARSSLLMTVDQWTPPLTVTLSTALSNGLLL